jgi:uncharacterized membrane protein YbaN (DUF454 family)
VAEAVAAGAPVIQIGAFLNTVINFLIVAFTIFMVVRAYTQAQARFVRREIAKEAPAAPSPTPDIQLLTEIRDLLSARSRSGLSHRPGVGPGVQAAHPDRGDRGYDGAHARRRPPSTETPPPVERAFVRRRASGPGSTTATRSGCSATRCSASSFLAIGWLCVVSGAIGVVLPGWPTTIWIILATYFFARSSPRFYNWLMNHRIFGPLIRDWRDGKGMTARTKKMAVGTIVVTIGISIVLLIPVVAEGAPGDDRARPLHLPAALADEAGAARVA